MVSDEIKAAAFRYLNRRDYSVKELSGKLSEKGFCDEDIRDCCSMLEHINVLNDERYAGLVVRHYVQKGCGINRIRQELSRRGIDKALIDEALEEVPEGDEVLDRLVAARLPDSPDRKDISRVAGALIRKGFVSRDVWNAIYRVTREEAIPGDDNYS